MNHKEGIAHFTIIRILKTFSPKEIHEFELLLASPFFNNHSTVIKLFKELIKYYPEFSDKSLTKFLLFNAVNKGKKYDDRVFRKYLSRLNKLAEEYLNILQMRSESARKDLNVLSQFSKRSLNGSFVKKLSALEKSLGRNSRIDGDNYFFMHKLDIVKYNHQSLQNRIHPMYEDLSSSYINLLNYFMFYTNSVRSQASINTYSFNETGKAKKLTDITKKFLHPSLLSEIQISAGDKNSLLMNLIANEVKMDSDDSGMEGFADLKQLVFHNFSKLSTGMQYYYLQKLNVFCALECAKGNDMNRELFENNKLILENNLLNINGSKIMTLLDFRLILKSALKTGEIEWAEQFVNKNLDNVTDILKNNLRNYSYALLHFERNEISEALKSISEIRSEPAPIKLDIYSLRLKIFYKLKHYDSALSAADSIRHYVSNSNLLSDFHKATILNFLKFFRLMTRLRQKKHIMKIKDLINDISKTENTKDRKWLIEEANALITEE